MGRGGGGYCPLAHHCPTPTFQPGFLHLRTKSSCVKGTPAHNPPVLKGHLLIILLVKGTPAHNPPFKGTPAHHNPPVLKGHLQKSLLLKGHLLKILPLKGCLLNGHILMQ